LKKAGFHINRNKGLGSSQIHFLARRHEPATI